jgi:large subunit ribosomal protein L4
LNKKVKGLARKSAWHTKQKIMLSLLLKILNIEAPKTKEFIAIDKNLKVDDRKF